MTTSILEALIQLFALFAAGRGKEGIALGRAHAARYMRNQLPKAWADQSLERFDELVDQFQRMPGNGEEMRAKRLAKLSVKLLRTCSQINKGLEWHEKHVVVVRLLEYLHEVPDHETGKLFLKTVSESFSIEETRLLALQSMVDQPVLGDHDETELFELNASFWVADLVAKWSGCTWKRATCSCFGLQMKVSSASTTKTFSRVWWPCWPLVEPFETAWVQPCFTVNLWRTDRSR